MTNMPAGGAGMSPRAEATSPLASCGGDRPAAEKKQTRGGWRHWQKLTSNVGAVGRCGDTERLLGVDTNTPQPQRDT